MIVLQDKLQPRQQELGPVVCSGNWAGSHFGNPDSKEAPVGKVLGVKPKGAGHEATATRLPHNAEQRPAQLSKIPGIFLLSWLSSVSGSTCTTSALSDEDTN